MWPPKGALHQLTASLAAQLMPRAITVNCVNPGRNDTGYVPDEIPREVPQYLEGAGGPLTTPSASSLGWSTAKPSGSRAR
jgi:3-oxoacyl-[acyl-carrier protein] reductase